MDCGHAKRKTALRTREGRFFFRAYPNVLVECLHSLTSDPWPLTSSSHFAIGRARRLW